MKVNERVKTWKEISVTLMQNGGPFTLKECKKTPSGTKNFHVTIKNEYGSTIVCTCHLCAAKMRLPKLSTEENLDLAAWLRKVVNNLFQY